MKKQQFFEKRQRFSIRKFKFGAASALIGAFFVVSGTVSAQEETVASEVTSEVTPEVMEAEVLAEQPIVEETVAVVEESTEEVVEETTEANVEETTAVDEAEQARLAEIARERQALQTAIAERGNEASNQTSDYVNADEDAKATYEQALATAFALLEDGNATADQLRQATEGLISAERGLVARQLTGEHRAVTSNSPTTNIRRTLVVALQQLSLTHKQGKK